jgi:hypothetical protein
VKKKPNRQLQSAIGISLIALASSAAAAQPTPEELLKQLKSLQATVEALQKQVKEQGATLEKTRESLPEGAELATTDDINGLKSDLEDYKYNNSRDREYKTALSTRGLTIGGTLLGVYTKSTDPTVATSNLPAGTKAQDSFSASATLSFKGRLYRDYSEGKNLDYALGLAFSNAKFTNSSSTTTTPQQGDSVVKVTDLYLQYSLVRNLGGLEDPKLTVTFGQQKLPFGLEAQVSDELKPTVSTAQFLGASALSQLNKRQIGVILRGDYEPTVDFTTNYRSPLVEYAFGVVNGNGENTADNNSKKDVIGRVAFTVPADFTSIFRELKFGASYYAGWNLLTNSSSTILKDAAHSTRKGIDVYYNHNPVGVTYERVDGVDETYITATQTNSNTQQIKSQGQVLTLFYNFGDIAQWSTNLKNVGKFDDFWPTTSQIYYRYDKWDPNIYVSNNEIIKNTLGYNIFFAETTKFQVGLTRTSYRGQANVSVADLTAQFQYGF